MKRVLIISDTHGDTDSCISIISNAPRRFDAVIHAGDCVRDAEDLEYVYPNIPIHYVRGNNDIFSRAPDNLTICFEDVRVFITHGHEQRVKYESTLTTLMKAAAPHKPSLVVFGHTHEPLTEYKGSVTVLNPGSIRYSHTYAVAEFSGGTVKTQILKLN